jgi:phosphoribosylformylglycinamidine synthase
LEPSRRYLITSTRPLTTEEKAAFAALVHDRMTEEVYQTPAATFAVQTVPAPVFSVPVMEKGRPALETINEVGCDAFFKFSCAGFWCFELYTRLFSIV